MKSDLRDPRVFFMFLLFSPLDVSCTPCCDSPTLEGKCTTSKRFDTWQISSISFSWVCVISPRWGTSDRQTDSFLHHTHSTKISASSREDSSHEGALLITKRLWRIHTKFISWPWFSEENPGIVTYLDTTLDTLKKMYDWCSP